MAFREDSACIPVSQAMRRSDVRYVKLVLAIAFLIAAAPTVGFAQEEEPRAPSAGQPGSVIVEEDDLMVLADEPAEHFQRAYDSFVKGDMKATAVEIHKGAAFLKLQAARATGKGKDALAASSQELRNLAEKVKDGAVKSGDELQEAFARADHALARHHQLKAAELWVKERAKRTGQDLRAAAIHLKQGLAWAGQKSEAAGPTAVERARDLAGKLIEGTGYVRSKVGPVMESVGEEISELGKKVSAPTQRGE